MLVETGSIIPKGYSVAITSWENDGDHYNTVNQHGLSYEQAVFLVSVAKLYTSNKYGNKEFNDFVIDDMLELVEKSEIKEEVLKLLSLYNIDLYNEELDSYCVLEFIQSCILGNPVEYDYEFCRVFSDAEIFLIEEDFIVPEFKRIKIM